MKAAPTAKSWYASAIVTPSGASAEASADRSLPVPWLVASQNRCSTRSPPPATLVPKRSVSPRSMSHAAYGDPS